MSLRFLSLVVGALVMVVGFTTGAFAQNFERGHEALQIWDKQAMESVPPLLKYWLYVMMGAFALGLLFVWRHPIARWVLGGFLMTIVLAGFVLPALNVTMFSGLVALVHLFCWSPALYMLLKHKPFLAGFTPFALWSGLITLVILISFFFDIRDAAIYLDHISGMGMLA